MLSFLNKPYPHSTNFKRNFIVSLSIGLFVALFLVVFKPFGISEWQDPQRNIKLAGFGLISFLIPLVFSLGKLLLPVAEQEDNWKVWKELVNILLSVMLIAAGNLFYSSVIGLGQVNAESYFRFLLITFAIGIFPIGFSIAAKYNKFLRLNQQTASDINNVLDLKENAPEIKEKIVSQKLILTAENEKDTLKLDTDQLLFIESADNYTMIHFFDDNSVTKTLVRSSLKRMEQQCQGYSSIIRCHRAFIVNTGNVTHVEGNAAGYRLTIKNSQIKVPVSRNYSNLVVQKLKDLQKGAQPLSRAQF